MAKHLKPNTKIWLTRNGYVCTNILSDSQYYDCLKIGITRLVKQGKVKVEQYEPKRKQSRLR